MCISACFIVAFLFRYLHVAVRVVRPFAEIVVRFLRLAEDVDDHFVLPGCEAPLPDTEVQCREACPQVAFGPQYFEQPPPCVPFGGVGKIQCGQSRHVIHVLFHEKCVFVS